ncbi:MAG: MAPEG family protein [Woeseiaceae bacterium]|nr:MAPEG family protein [Woeseiaceae bacterium]
MTMPITLMYASIFALFGLFLSFRAGSFRGKTGISVLYGEPQNMELAERARVHQNFLEYVPLVVIMMAAIEVNGGSPWFLFVVGDLLILFRIAHAVGLRHDNIAHKGRFIGAFGTMLVSVACAAYGLWLSWDAVWAIVS